MEELKALSRQLAGPTLRIKRDDQTGLALGGNKTRKLEFLLGDALAKGADTLITLGAVQSNHCRQTAAAAAKDTDFIPPALKDQVLANIPTLGPRKSGEVVFTVPAPGEYPFLCTFPAHYQVGMKGTLIVK